MARFPRREDGIVGLAGKVSAGLTANPGVYPAPPVAPADLETALGNYVSARDAAVAAAAAREQASAAKRAALAALTDALKADLRYAENAVDFDDDQLKLLGWGARKPGASLEAPGQPRALEAPRQGEDSIFLDWKAPVDGGKVASYTIQRRERPDGAWSIAGVATQTEANLTAQQRGTEFEYRVIAVNKAGESPPSNTVMAVL